MSNWPHWDRHYCQICRRPGHNRRTCPERTKPALPAGRRQPDRFAEYCKASDAVKEAQTQLLALGEHELAQQAEQLYFAITRAYWAHARAGQGKANHTE
jgi:hypothetical protein